MVEEYSANPNLERVSVQGEEQPEPSESGSRETSAKETSEENTEEGSVYN